MFFKKAKNNDIYAPITGKCVDISNVNDKTFADKVLGDGIAVIPDGNTVCAPADGKLAMIFNTNHAFGIKMKNGVELLVHIGIDTVELNGKGFKALKRVNEAVKKGEPVITFDQTMMEDKNVDMTTMLIITKDNNVKYQKNKVNEFVSEADCILKCE